MSGTSLPPLGRPMGARGPSAPGAPSADGVRADGPGGPGRSDRAPAKGSGGGRRTSGRPSVIPIVGVACLLVLGLVGAAVGFARWDDAGELAVPAHVGIAAACVFGSVVLLARFRKDVTARRAAGNLVRTRLLDVRTVTGIALVAWASGIGHVAMVAYELSARGGW